MFACVKWTKNTTDDERKKMHTYDVANKENFFPYSQNRHTQTQWKWMRKNLSLKESLSDDHNEEKCITCGHIIKMFKICS